MQTKQLYQSFDFEFKGTQEDDEFFYFEGYGSTFGNEDLGQDVVTKGAFTDTLKTRMPKMCYQHDMTRPIGVWTDVSENSKGLFMKGKMPKANSLVKDTMALMKCGALDSMSIGFNIPKGGSEYNDKGVRIIKKIDLFEVSIVTMPMNPKATVTAMKKFSIEDVENIKTKRDLGELLHETGAFSKRAVDFIVSKMRSVKPGDPDALIDDLEDEDDKNKKPPQGDPDENLDAILHSLTSIQQAIGA